MFRLTTAARVNDHRRLAGLEWALLVVVVGCGFWLRVRSIHESLWLDELHTAWVAAGTLDELTHRAQLGNQSPLYPALVWAVTRLSGLSECSLRFVSLCGGVALIVTGYFIGRKWCDSSELGLLVAFLIAIDPHSIYFSQEARPYVLVQWCGVMQLACFARLMQQRSTARRYSLVGLSCTLFYLHYTSLLLLVGEGVYLAIGGICRWYRFRRDVLPRILDAAAVVMGTIPAWSHLWHIAARRDNWSRFVTPQPFGQVLTLFRMDALIAVPLLVFAILFAIAWVKGGRWLLPSAIAQRIVLTCSCIAVPILLAWLFTEYDWLRLYFRRYLIVVAALPMLLAGLIGRIIPAPTTRCLYAAGVAACAAVMLMPIHPTPIGGVAHWHSQEDWRSAVGFINRQPGAKDWPVFVRAGLIEDDLLRTELETDALRAYCLLPIGSLYRLEARTGPVLPVPSAGSWQLTQAERAEIERAGGAWMLVRGNESTADRIGQNLIVWLRQNGALGYQVADHYFGQVAVLRIAATRQGMTQE